MTINELFTQALELENSLVAHALYAGIRNGDIDGADPADEKTFERINQQKAFQFYKENTLGIKLTNLYAVPLASGEFAMFFAENLDDVKKLFKQNFHIDCKKIFEMNHGMDMSMYSLDTRKHETWREIRDSLQTIPAYVGTFIK